MVTDKSDGRRSGGIFLGMLKIVGGAVLGLVIGYFVGVALGCWVLMPNSNLCGFVGVFITGPLGFLVGGFYGGWRAFADD
jgi:hypothetical protein